MNKDQIKELELCINLSNKSQAKQIKQQLTKLIK